MSRRRICRIMREMGPGRRLCEDKIQAASPESGRRRGAEHRQQAFRRSPPRTHIVGGLACVRAGARWCCIRLPIGPCNREIVGRSAGERKDARLVKLAFATLDFPLDEIGVFHTDRGSEFDNAAIDGFLEVFGIERSLSARGCPYDNSVDASTDKILKAELVYRESFPTLQDLQVRLSDYVHWYNHFRLHSTLGYMGPMEFRLAGLTL